MNAVQQPKRLRILGTLAAAAISIAAFSNMAFADEIKVTLSGDQETPPVKTAASGSGTITINADMTVSGSVTTSGVAGTAAHIHDAAPGQSGPVVLALTKSGDNAWSIPAGAKLTDAQYKEYKAGNLYVNVHSAANKGGEVRGQIKPK